MSVLTPPRISEILPDIKALLDVGSMQSILGGTGRVLVAKGNSIDTKFPTVDANGFAGRIVLMLRNDSPSELLDLTIPVYWNLRVDVLCSEQDDPDAITDHIHNEAYKLVQNTKLSLDFADQVFKNWRKEAPIRLWRDDEGWYYKAAKWQTIVTSKT